MRRMHEEVARLLLEIEAVKFSPHSPITFKSGIKSPIYVDNRIIPFWPRQWRIIIQDFQRVIEALNSPFDVIAGVEAAGIPHSAALAYSMRKPSVFVRKQPKEHGTKSRIEGGDVTDKCVLLVEDLITTGGSSLSGVAALREAGAIIEDCLAIVSYGFSDAIESFTDAGVRLHTLTSFHLIVEQAMKQGDFSQQDMDIIHDWLKDPYGWAERHDYA